MYVNIHTYSYTCVHTCVSAHTYQLIHMIPADVYHYPELNELTIMAHNTQTKCPCTVCMYIDIMQFIILIACLVEAPTNGISLLGACQPIHLKSRVSDEVMVMMWELLSQQRPPGKRPPEELLRVSPAQPATLAFLWQVRCVRQVGWIMVCVHVSSICVLICTCVAVFAHLACECSTLPVFPEPILVVSYCGAGMA